MKNKIIYLDQVIGPLSIDIINFFNSKHDDVLCLYGEQISTHQLIDRNVSKRKFNRYRRSTTIKRIFSWVQFFISTLGFLLIKKKQYKIFAVSNPPLNAFTCLILNYLFGIKYSLLIYDLYPQAFIEYGYARRSSIIIRFWEYLNQKSYIRAEYIYTISDTMSKVISEKGYNVKTIQMWADTDNIRPIDKSKNWFRKSLNLNDKFVILYSGNFGETHDLESIVKAAEILKNNENLHFLFIGDGRKRKMLEESVSQKQLNNVTIMPFQDEKTFPFSITSGDVSIVTLDERAANLSIPSKIFYYMASGSAIITISKETSELANLVDKYNCGFNIKQSQKSHLAKILVELSSDESRINIFKKNAREASRFHSRENVKEIII